ncbi:hypothetical protein CHARACLAT_002907 [Characodon lateralis]|uniref:Uncharacterized protein n=1 Tax=Characodon lateralis TaxID=208331 RepID=A0ABU7CUS8_9TELE|nr:hypothetical protein [Characodon lateralis]
MVLIGGSAIRAEDLIPHPPPPPASTAVRTMKLLKTENRKMEYERAMRLNCLSSADSEQLHGGSNAGGRS